jgi:hypothetical protein
MLVKEILTRIKTSFKGFWGEVYLCILMERCILYIDAKMYGDCKRETDHPMKHNVVAEGTFPR